MDNTRFDALTRALAAPAGRRAALRLLAGGLLGGLLPARAAAQRPDRDGDGLFDDDEANVYGTNPDVWDTDGDGSFDGEEVYSGTDPLDPGSNTAVLGDGNDVANGGAPPADTVDIAVPPPPVCPAGLTACGTACIDLLSDGLNCGACEISCGPARACHNGVCTACVAVDAATGECLGDLGGGFGDDAVAGNGGVATCAGVRFSCDFDAQCCNSPKVRCCWNSVYLRTQCEDTSANGGACIEL